MPEQEKRCHQRRHLALLNFVGRVKRGEAPPIGFPVDLRALAQQAIPLCPDCGSPLLRSSSSREPSHD